jgi:hypothetical protein
MIKRNIHLFLYVIVLVLFFSSSAGATVSNLLRLKIAGTFGADETVIYFDPLATDGFDGNFDALKMYAGTPGLPNISSRSGNAEFAINVLGAFNHQRDVPLSVYITRNGSYTISVLEVLDFAPTALIYMEDLVTGISYNLLTEQELQFNFNSGFYANRFVLHFFLPISFSVSEETCNLGDGKIQMVNPSTNPWKASLYSEYGQQLSELVSFSQEYSFQNLPSGNYRVKLEKGSFYSVIVSFSIQAGIPVKSEFQAPPGPVKLNYQTPFSAINPETQNSYSWNFGDGTGEFTGPEVIHAFTQPGIYTVKLSVSNGSCSRTSVQAFTVLQPGEPTGIEESQNSLHFILYPNPAADIITLRINLLGSDDVQWIEVQDLSGRTISREFVNGMMVDGKISIPVSHLNNGIYRAVLSTQKAQVSKPYTIAR